MQRPQPVVVYIRVSTERQGRSGLGIEAQRAAVREYLAGSACEQVAEFVEVESGTRRDRPQLAAALSAARLHRATLVIAKLDRLSRDAGFLLGLQKAGVRFVACDMVSANEMVVGIMAVVAQAEREMISQRTKAALAAAKARGTVLGGFRGYVGTPDDLNRARASYAAQADQRAADLAGTIAALQASGVTSLGALAAALNTRRISAPRGGSWSAVQVRRVLQRLSNLQMSA
jgi:DNA invertase Pin-like site-specific DNA recombinase